MRQLYIFIQKNVVIIPVSFKFWLSLRLFFYVLIRKVHDKAKPILRVSDSLIYADFLNRHLTQLIL